VRRASRWPRAPPTSRLAENWLLRIEGDPERLDSVPLPTRRRRTAAFYTNYGTNAITVAAPGGDADLDAFGSVEGAVQDLVLSTVPGGYGYKAGTSMAAPQVAGAAALVKSVHPEYNANQVESVLKRTAEVPGEYERTNYGAGVIDPADAVHD
jgi:subtilisin family serine protease